MSGAERSSASCNVTVGGKRNCQSGEQQGWIFVKKFHFDYALLRRQMEYATADWELARKGKGNVAKNLLLEKGQNTMPPYAGIMYIGYRVSMPSLRSVVKKMSSTASLHYLVCRNDQSQNDPSRIARDARLYA